ncbi:DUF6907 domain-containing protein [Mycobacterium sp. RTGN3]|uniref:DUF6907 domain-containing protein n=1 Tax=unclassified Mycobacterium TaxID=2642494 RepID=UPI0039AEE6D1
MREDHAAVAESTCPTWCVEEGVACQDPLWHVSESHVLELVCPGEPRCRESVEVRAAQYLADDSDRATWVPTVELAHHVGNRYRVIHLSPADARQLAELLSRAADQLDGPIS